MCFIHNLLAIEFSKSMLNDVFYMKLELIIVVMIYLTILTSFITLLVLSKSYS